MHSFNLTFKGEIKPGYKAGQVKRRFAELLGLEDARELARCFSGEPVTLRRNLDRRTAADLYHKLDQLGAVVELVMAEQATAEREVAEPERPAPEPLRTNGDTLRQAKARKAQIKTQIVERKRQQRKTRRKAWDACRTNAAALRARLATAARLLAAATVKRATAALTGATTALATAASVVMATAAPLAPTDRDKSPATPKRAAPPEAGGAPNLYALTPFRASAMLRERPATARRRKLHFLVLATASLAALLVVILLRRLLPSPVLVTGPDAVAPLHGGGLALAIPGRLLIHDRAGTGEQTLALDTLGLARVTAMWPVPQAKDNAYLILGRALSSTDGGPTDQQVLWRCGLAPPQCRPFGPQSPAPETVAIHPYYGLVLEAVAGDTLRKLDRDGELLASATRSLPPKPALLLRDGLLFGNSAGAPALSVMRYEDNALGRQLDEILLLAPSALAAGREQVADFAVLGAQWWAILHNPESGERGLYLFDHQWGFEREVPLPAGFNPEQLLVWGEKMLVRDPRQVAMQRFNNEGQMEAPLRSDLLQAIVDTQQQNQDLRQLLWRVLVAVLLLALVGCTALYRLQHLRQLAFKPERLRGAEPIEHRADEIHWLGHSPRRDQRTRSLTRLYAAVACVVLVGAVALRIEAHYLASLLLLLAGPAAALVRYRRGRRGHIGVLGDQLLLVDHRNQYHLGSGARILFRGWFLMIDDVLVHAGPGWAPAFDTEQLRERIVPLAHLGIQVDRRAIIARLVEARHPLVDCAGLVLGSSIAALALLLLYQGP